MQKELVDILTDLVAFKSTKDSPEALHAVVQYVEDYFKGMKVVIRTYESNGKPSIVILSQDTMSPTLFLNGHLDVVEADDSLFSMTQDGDRLQGRGVFDMKGYVAVMMLAFKQIVTQNPDVSIGLALTTDEEIGGMNGLRYLLEDEGYSCDVAYVPDGGESFSVVTDEKGIAHFKVSAHGESAHGARPWLGVNANEILMKLYKEIRDGFDNPTNEEDWKRSLNLGRFSGGEATNQVPDYAEMYLDIRFPYPDTPETISTLIQGYCDRHESVEVELLASGHVSHIDQDNEYLQQYVEAIESVTGKQTSFERAAGASDGRFFSAKGVSVIMSRGAGGGQHAPDEWASLSDLEVSINILIAFASKLLNESA